MALSRSELMRLPATRAGDLELKIPKVRRGSFFPSPLECRRRIARALSVVVMEAYTHGVSPRSVDDLTAFKGRSLDHTVFPYVFPDATYCEARVNHRIVSQAVVIATGISAAGLREIPAVGPGNDQRHPPERKDAQVTHSAPPGTRTPDPLIKSQLL